MMATCCIFAETHDFVVSHTEGFPPYYDISANVIKLSVYFMYISHVCKNNTE